MRGKGTKVTDVTWDDSHTTFSMELPDYGTWDVEVGIKYSTENKIIYSSKEPVEIIQGGPTSYSKNFIAKPSQSDDKNGKINLEISTATNSGINFVQINLLNGNSTNWNTLFSGTNCILPVLSNKITIGGSGKNLPSGNYTVQIDFYDYNSFNANDLPSAAAAVSTGGAVLVYSTIQTINIYDDLITNRWVSVNSDANNPIDSSGKFTITQNILNSYTLTNICVASNGSDSNFGTVYNPYKTLDKAISYINERGSSSNDFTISVSGDVECNTEISLATTKAKTLTIKGKSGSNANDKLNGKSNGRVLKLNTGITVTIENLTITGGDAKTGSDDDKSGGGIYLANGTLKLGDGAKISGNHAAAFGGGVYVASGTKLFMYGSSLIGDTIQATATSSTLTSSGTTGCANAAVGGGGGLYNNGGEVYIGYNGLSGDTPQKSDMTSGYGVRRNYSERTYGGGICNRKGTLIIASGSVSYNQCVGGNGTAGAGGGIFNAYELTPATSLTIEAPANTSNKFVMYGNKAVRGGAICNNTDGVITIKAGQIGGSASNLQNTATENGGAVYHGGKTLSVSGTALIYTGSEKTNDVYLPSGNTIYVSDSLNETNVATVTPANYKRGTDILSVASSVTINDTLKSKFKLSADNDGWERKDKTVSGNKYVYITSPIYVVDSTDSGNTRPTGFNKGLSTGANGTKTSPYASIAAAAQASDLSEAGGKITIAGTLTGTQTISSVTNGVSSVTLAGYNTNATINGNANGSALTISVAKTFTIQQLQITNGKASAGGGINITSGSGTVVNLDSDAKVYSNKATSGGTGAGVYVASGATLNIKTDSAIYSNTAYSGNINGAGVYNVGTVNMSGGSVYSNSAYQGGGIYNAGSLSMTGGEIGKTSYYNSSSNAGGAIYNKGSATLNNSISIPYGGSEKSNDIAVYYDTSLATPALKMISADANLIASNIALTPTSWIRGKQILTGTAGKYSCFKMTDTEWSIISSSTSSTHAGKIDADIYVAPTGSTTTINSVTYGKGATPANGGRGTKAKPYSTIADAVAQCWGGPNDIKTSTSGGVTTIVGRRINIVGTISGSQTIGNSITTSNANNIWLRGINTDATLSGGFGANKPGTVLTIGTSVPVELQNLTVTGGYNTNGGGIYVSAAGASLTLTNSVTVTGNTATSNGGGIYFAGTSALKANLIMKGSSISKIDSNVAGSNGGGVYLSNANLCMSGYSMIGPLNANATAQSGSSAHSNQAANGAGVYADSGASVWLGYTEASDSSTADLASGYGIKYNYATASGGGIYFAGANLKLYSGIVSFNQCVSSGGGIYANGTTQEISGAVKMELNKAQDGGAVTIGYGDTLTMSGAATFIKNIATRQGGAINNGGKFVMSNGTIGGTTPADTASTYKNTASGAGGAVYMQSTATFEMSGNAYIPYGGSEKYNDVRLSTANRSIKVTGTLSNHTNDPVYITPYTYEGAGTASAPTVLTGSYVSSENLKFSTTTFGHHVDTAGKLTDDSSEYIAMPGNVLNVLNSIPDDDYMHTVKVTGTLDSDGLTAIANAIKNTTTTKDVEIDISDVTVSGTLDMSNAFKNCTKLKTITLDVNKTPLSSTMFDGCSNLNGVTISGNINSWPSGIFDNCGTIYSLGFTNSTSVTIPGTDVFKSPKYDDAISTTIMLPKTLQTLKIGALDGRFQTQAGIRYDGSSAQLHNNVTITKASTNIQTKVQIRCFGEDGWPWYYWKSRKSGVSGGGFVDTYEEWNSAYN